MRLQNFAWFSPFFAGAFTIAGALIHANSYRLHRRTIIFTNDVKASNIDSDSFRKINKTLQNSKIKPQRSAESIRILHLSDTHLLQNQLRRQNFLRSLSAQNPDLIILTGDLISEDAAIAPLLEALSVFRGIPGGYVFGSNDYFAPKPKNPFNYFYKNSSLSKSKPPRRLDTPRLTDGLNDLGFQNLNNATAKFSVGTWDLELIGVNDPHIGFAKYPSLAPLNSAQNSFSQNLADDFENKNTQNTLRIGLTHAPYAEVLSWMQNAGCELVFAGHTHGGQVCLPGNRALVTNCDLPRSHAAGLFKWPLYSGADQKISNSQLPLRKNGVLIGKNLRNTRNFKKNTEFTSEVKYSSHEIEYLPDSQMIVQVSAGIGTSPFTPVRTFCPPEAVLIEVMKISQ